MKSTKVSARRVVITSFIVDLTDVLLNIGIAIISGSAVLLTEALQGVADLLTSGLLWIGVQRSKRRPTREHKFGYGKELFFWILMAGVSMLVLTAGFSLYFGISRILHPHPLHQLPLAIVVLVLGFLSNLYALSLSLRRLDVRYAAGWRSVIRTVRNSTMIETKATAILDLMGSAAAVLGLISLAVYAVTGDGRFDGVGALVIGLSCAVFAIFLIFEVKDFIVGRTASPEIEGRIKRTAEAVGGVHQVLDLRTMQMGSEKVMVNMEVHIDQQLTTQDIERLMDDLKAAVRADVPEVQHIQVEVETPTRNQRLRI